MPAQGRAGAGTPNMECYQIKQMLQPVEAEVLSQPDRGLAVIWAMGDGQALPAGVMPPSVRGARFCKAERRRDCLCGAMVIPGREPFGYTVTGDTVVFQDSGGTVRPCLRQIAREQSWREPGLGIFLYDIWELLTADDLKRLSELDSQITKLENTVLSGASGAFHQKLMAVRRKVMVYVRYYAQMDDVIYKFLENGNGYFTQEDLRLFQLFRERIGRLGDEAQNLREHCLQVWELFQAELDLRQNRIMKILTIVTTVFMPLTLLVGWYGMNFRNMPEMTWEYGYPVMILVSILMVALTIWLLKKKKLW